MKEETNRYAMDWATRHPHDAASHMKPWEDVDEEELQCYLGLRMLMVIHKLPEMWNYWSNNRLLGVPVFGEYMTRDRFDQITSRTHFVDNGTNPGDDKPWKIQPVVDTLLTQFRDFYVPDSSIAIDESLFR